MAKMFSIQAPEEIAKRYAGNKQQIAQASQMGIVDPTAAVLAGMFIDRMRAAQVMETGQMPSVAQQVLGGQTPQGAPPPPPAGLGATPQAGGMPPMGPPPPPQDMGPPPQEMGPPPQDMPMMAEGGMVPPYASGGGLSELPVPDTMFDEPSNGGFNDGYAGGGMVAFAPGGDVDFGDYIEQTVRKLDPNIQIAGRARTPARNAEVGGVNNSYHLINAARDITVPPGMSKSQFISQLKGTFGADYDVLPSKGNSVHIEPGPQLGEKVRAGARPSGVPTIIPERNISTAEGRGLSMEDSLGLSRRLLQDPEEYTKAKEDVRARYAEMQTPEYYEKQRKDSMWETLAAIGFNMASSKAPSLLQAIGEAASAALPGAQADKKERKALKDRALDGLLQLGAKDRAEAKDALALGMDIYQTGVKQEQFEQELDFKKNVSKEELNIARRQVAAAETAAKNKGADVNQTVFAMYMSGNPALKLAAEEWIELNKSSKDSEAGPFDGPLKDQTGKTGAEDPFAKFSATRN